jgi:serine/threonine protein kinase
MRSFETLFVAITNIQHVFLAVHHWLNNIASCFRLQSRFELLLSSVGRSVCRHRRRQHERGVVHRDLKSENVYDPGCVRNLLRLFVLSFLFLSVLWKKKRELFDFINCWRFVLLFFLFARAKIFVVTRRRHWRSIRDRYFSISVRSITLAFVRSFVRCSTHSLVCIRYALLLSISMFTTIVVGSPSLIPLPSPAGFRRLWRGVFGQRCARNVARQRYALCRLVSLVLSCLLSVSLCLAVLSWSCLVFRHLV